MEKVHESVPQTGVPAKHSFVGPGHAAPASPGVLPGHIIPLGPLCRSGGWARANKEGGLLVSFAPWGYAKREQFIERVEREFQERQREQEQPEQ